MRGHIDIVKNVNNIRRTNRRPRDRNRRTGPEQAEPCGTGGTGGTGGTVGRGRELVGTGIGAAEQQDRHRCSGTAGVRVLFVAGSNQLW